ncbi:uncharacterized protein [Lepeophtheirus salmonis]|uniref:uncharacterized protein n=1 Tax=Lepeophtheirus salmonis TaxID=72036 RepID=UPI001AE16D85|nr:uncharacterized protein LOC121118986 [Lepeophtheirus salmonis]
MFSFQKHLSKVLFFMKLTSDFFCLAQKDDDTCWYNNFCKGSDFDYCGETMKPPMSCSCDPDCIFFGDCCFRYEAHCASKESIIPLEFVHHRGEVECIRSVPNIYNQVIRPGIYMIASCPTHFKGDTKLGLMCDMVGQPKDIFIDGTVVYKNKFCYKCWKGYEANRIHQILSLKQRNCVPKLNSCLYSDMINPDFPFLTQSCNSHILPVFVPNFSSGTDSLTEMVYFKNADCLACSNQMYTQEDGFCFDPYNNISLFSMHRSIYSETTIPIERSIMKNYFNFGVPDSLSIMITFGLDSSKIMYSADSWFHNCPANHIWDPFSKCCRKIFCNIGSQVNKCDSSPISEGTGFNSLVLPSKEVHINLTAQVIMFNNTLEEVKNTLEDIFFSKFANTFSISMSRLSHIHVQYVETRKLSNELLIIRDWITSSLILIKEGIWRVPTDLPSVNEVLNAFNVILSQNHVFVFSIIFHLSDISTESYEYSTQDLLASLVDLTMQNNFIISLSDEAYVSITSIQENSFYDQEDIWFWCRGGTLQTYLNEEFEIKINKSLDSDDLEMSVYILEKDKWYTKGTYIANLLFRGEYFSTQKNVTGIVKVCENRAKLNESMCNRMLFSFNEFQWNESERKIKFIGPKRFGVKENLEAWEYTVHPSGVEVCIELDIHGFGLDNIIETWLSLIVTSVSIICLFLTFLIYCLFSELRNLPGLNLMGLVGSTFAYQLLFITGAHRQTSSGKPIICILIAITIHFLTLVMFSWTNIIAWDLYKTFGKDGLLKKQRPKQTFMKYLIYSISLPSVIVGMAVAFNNTGVFLVDYGKFTCWIGNKQGSIIFFGVPFVLSTILNLVLYILTTMNIHKTATGVQNNRFSSSLSSIQSTSITSFDRRRKDRRNQKMKNVIIYIRMFSVLGITWFIGIIGMFIKPERSDIESVLMRFVVYSHVICNGLYGVFIFIIFGCNQKIYRLLKLKYFKKSTSTKMQSCQCGTNKKGCLNRISKNELNESVKIRY